MKKLHIILYLFSIFVIQLDAKAIDKEYVFDIIPSYFTKCEVFAKNVLINTTTRYWSTCKDVSLVNLPETFNVLNINKFYCIGMLAADMHLCKVLNNDYNSLPETTDDLESYISVLRNVSAENMCLSLKNITLFNDDTVQPSLLKTVTVLKQKLSGSECSRLCSDLKGNTNELCVMLYMIHYHINSIINTEQSKKKTEISTTEVKQMKINAIAQSHSTQQSIDLSADKLQLAKKVENKGVEIIASTISPKDTKEGTTNQADIKSKGVNSETSQTIMEIKDENEKKFKSTEAVVGSQDEINIDENISAATTTENIKTIVDNSNYDDIIDGNLKLPNDDENPIVVKVQEDLTNSKINSISKEKHYDEVEESNFFSYFMFISVMFIAGYVVYHNKQKIMALVLEGRRDRNSRRRPSTSSYRKLNSNLEEAVTSKCSGSASHVIY